MFLLNIEPGMIDKACPTPIVVGSVGEDVTLSCPYFGLPLVQEINVIWSREGEELSGRISFVNQSMGLVISSLEDGDAGLYNCTVSNIVNGERHTDTYIIQLVAQSKCTRHSILYVGGAPELSRVPCWEVPLSYPESPVGRCP